MKMVEVESVENDRWGWTPEKEACCDFGKSTPQGIAPELDALQRVGRLLAEHSCRQPHHVNQEVPDMSLPCLVFLFLGHWRHCRLKGVQPGINYLFYASLCLFLLLVFAGRQARSVFFAGYA